MSESNKTKKELSETEEEYVNLDTVIREIGQFGRYQKMALGLCLLVALLSGYSGNEYVFTAARIPTRCLIPECEDNADFSPAWLSLAIPSVDGSFDNCRRFNSSGHSCSAESFDRDDVVKCEEYVYEKTDTVVYEFDLACQEWRRSLIGSVSIFGKMLALPLTGILADRYGRRTALALNAFNCAWLGVARYWTQSYASFITLEYLEAVFWSSWVFMRFYDWSVITSENVMEFMGPKYRVAAGALMSTFYSSGLILQALVAWAVPYWRHLTLALFIPQLVTVVYFWIMPESVRWYMSKGRYNEAEAQLKRAAIMNRTVLTEASLKKLRLSSERKKVELKQKVKEPWLVTLVFQYKPILLRCAITPVWWITTTLVYYGLSMNAVTMSGNKYINYMAVGAVEIPGFWTAVLLFDKIGRKPLLFAAFWMCAVCQFGFIFMTKNYYELSLAVYLFGKYSISIVVTCVYVYTNELFPTQYRGSLFSFASMVGRIGAISAPLTPALGTMVWKHLPFILFGGFAALSGLLVLLAPETKGATLPDTMQQAADLGKKTKNTVKLDETLRSD